MHHLVYMRYLWAPQVPPYKTNCGTFWSEVDFIQLLSASKKCSCRCGLRLTTGMHSAFHWQESAGAEVETLRFTWALFGLTTSLFLLGGVIDSHLSTWEEREPETVLNLKRELIYVDDLISGLTTILGRRVQIRYDNQIIYKVFRMKKWQEVNW